MTDRELLEMAAKAAGIPIDQSRFDEDEGYAYEGLARWWNPLRDDGHALALAAKLKIDIDWQSTGSFPAPDVEAYRRDEEGSYFCASEPEDQYRRAIVRAAAEIGKAMP